MGDVVDLPAVTMRAFAQVGDEKWALTEWVLNDPLKRRRLVRTQIEELLALYRQYPLPEFESVRQILTQLQQACHCGSRRWASSRGKTGSRRRT